MRDVTKTDNFQHNAPNKHNTAAVVISFHPDETFPVNFFAILEHVRTVFIIDNGSNKNALIMLSQLAENHDNVKLIANADNLGIAKALNIGSQAAIAAGFEWVMCMDQDSKPMSHWGQVMNEIYTCLPEPQRIGIMGSNFQHPGGRVEHSEKQNTKPYRLEKTVITSGSLLPLRVWQEVGPFREDYFIDLVDHEYCLRLHKYGKSVLISTQAILEHRLGDVVNIKIGCLSFHSSNHSAFRRYHIARNRVLLSRSYGLQQSGFILNQWFKMIRETFLVLFFEKEKFAKLSAILRGLFDGMIKKLT